MSSLRAMAEAGRFALQTCDDCGAVQYPPRDACVRCLGASLPWRDVPATGTVLAETTVRVSTDPWFQPRLPLRIGLVTLDCGPSVVAHLEDGVAAGQPTALTLRLDHAGRGVLTASSRPS